MEKISLVLATSQGLFFFFGLILAFAGLRAYQFTQDYGKLILTNHIYEILMKKPTEIFSVGWNIFLPAV